MAKLKNWKCYEYQVNNIKIAEGQLIYTTDTGKIFLDIDSKTRIQVNSIYKITSSEMATINPITNGIYYLTDTKMFYFYDGSNWIGFGGSFAGSSTPGGAANSATKLATARKINVNTGVVGTATSFDGSKDINIPITSIKEAYLSWGGKNFSGSFGPIDAAMISDLGANRLAFGSGDGITVEYSRDGGSTWTDYGATAAEKARLLSVGQSFIIGKGDSTNKATTDYMLRITLDSDKIPVYSVLNKFAIYVSTNGCNGCYCNIDASLESTPTVWINFANKVDITGWSGWNIINTSGLTAYGNSSAKASQYGLIRFTFGCTSGGGNAGLQIMRIMGFGGVGWVTPSNMAKHGHLYDYDSNGTATFPAGVKATSFTENGTALSAKYQAKGDYAASNHSHTTVNGHTVESDVPANANFSNTWRGIQNVLTSDSTTDSLSAAQGKALKALIDGKAASSHKHVKADITDFPTSMPASDVSAWAKAATKPTYTASEVGAAAASHGHASNGITAMTGYSKASSASAISTSDTLNTAIGKLEKALDGKQASGSYAASSHTHDDRYYTETEVDNKLSGKANSSHTHGNADITALDASKLTGTIDIARLPQGALERLKIVADDTARFKLTTSDVQLGDTVKVTATGKMYYVVDESKLTIEAGYEVYTAGTATSVPWSGVTGKPSTYTPSTHTHTKSQITDFPTLGTASAKDVASSGNASASQVVMGNDTRLTDARRASDVSDWAKAATKPTYTASEVGAAASDHTHNLSDMINTLGEQTTTPVDGDYMITQSANGGTTTKTYHRKPISALLTYIKSKLATVASSGSYNDLSDTPTIPSVGNGKVTIKQAGVEKGSFTLNQSGAATIELTDNNTTYTSKAAVSGGTDVSLVTTGEKATWNAKTSNTGTLTGIKMNGSSKGTSGVVDLGTVLTGGSQTTTSSADAGSNVYTFSDGSTIIVKNGSKGSTGSNGTSAAWFTGTAVTGTSTTATAFTVSGSKAGDMYLNTTTLNVYRAAAANSWVYVCNIKGATGAKGDKGDAGTNGTTPTIKAAAASTIGSVGTPTVTAATSGTTTTFTFDKLKGATGATGTRGSVINQGTAITGTSTTATVFSGSGLTSSLVNDLYMNTSTFNIYRCTVAGNAATAKWVYVGCIKGAKGDTGAKGEKGDQGEVGPKGDNGDLIHIGSTFASSTQKKIFFRTV